MVESTVLSYVRLIVFLLASLPSAARAVDQVPASETAGDASPPPIPPSVWIAGAATVGLATTTTILGLAALDLRREFDRVNRDAGQSVDDKTNLRSTALEVQHLATIAACATMAAAVTAVVLYIARPVGSERPGALGLAIVGGRLVLLGSF